MTSNDLSDRLSKLEVLIAEQEYTIESLNQVITRQDRDIDLMQQQIKHLTRRLDELKKQVPLEPGAPQDEIPPHY